MMDEESHLSSLQDGVAEVSGVESFDRDYVKDVVKRIQDEVFHSRVDEALLAERYGKAHGRRVDVLSRELWGFGAEHLSDWSFLGNKELQDKLSINKAEPTIEHIKLALQDDSISGLEKRELISFLAYDVWSEEEQLLAVGAHVTQNERENYLLKRKAVASMLGDCIPAFVKDRAVARDVFQACANLGYNDEAKAFIVDERLDEAGALEASVQYANVYGFMGLVDVLAKSVKDEGLPESVRGRCRSIYSKVHAEEASRISAELAEVYSRVRFEEYALNAEALTQEELQIIEDSMKSLGIGKDSVVVDVGAGVGRHAKMLTDLGYSKVIAVEAQPEHVAYMRNNCPDVEVIGGSWSDMSKSQNDGGVGLEVADYAYILGRSATHNRTPYQMLGCFDQLQAILKKRGGGMVDFENIESGERQKRVKALSENLAKIGIEAGVGGEIFDGPSDDERFDRLILEPNQVAAMFKLVGVEPDGTVSKVVDGGGFENVYYKFKKPENSNLSLMRREEFNKLCLEVGLFKPGVDYQEVYVEAWGMTLGQALVYVELFGLDNHYFRSLNEKGEAPRVKLLSDSKKIDLISDYMPKDKHTLARFFRSASPEEVDEIMDRYKSRDLHLRDIELAALTRKPGISFAESVRIAEWLGSNEKKVDPNYGSILTLFEKAESLEEFWMILDDLKIPTSGQADDTAANN